MRFCENPSVRTGGEYDKGTCVGYVRGVIDGTIDAWNTLLRSANGSQPFCAPAGVTVGQEQRIVLKYIKDHPEREHLLTSALVFRALSEAFPCSKHP